MTLNVGRGYDGWSSIRNAAARFRAHGGEDDSPAGFFLSDEVLAAFAKEIGVDLQSANDFAPTDRSACVLYFGDFDPSGEDMVRSLNQRLRFFGCRPEIAKVALTREDIETYHLPPDPTKASDTRAAAFVAEHGDIAVELDALPLDVLRARLETEVRDRMDLAALEKIRLVEAQEKAELSAALGVSGD